MRRKNSWLAIRTSNGDGGSLPDESWTDFFPWNSCLARRLTAFPIESTMLRQKKEKRRKRYAKKDSPDQLEDLRLLPFPLLHSLFHGCDDAVRFILRPVLRALLSRSWENETSAGWGFYLERCLAMLKRIEGSSCKINRRAERKMVPVKKCFTSWVTIDIQGSFYSLFLNFHS